MFAAVKTIGLPDESKNFAGKAKDLTLDTGFSAALKTPDKESGLPVPKANSLSNESLVKIVTSKDNYIPAGIFVFINIDNR